MYQGVLGIKKPIIGLDIGYKTLKVMQLKGEGTSAHFLGVSEIEIPPKSLSKDGLKDKKMIADSILRAMSSAKPHSISARLISTALPESLVFTKSLDLPKMNLAEINKAIPYQVGELFPVPPQEMYIDWQIVGYLPGEKSIDVLVVAAPKVIIDSLVETINMAGLELISLETKPIADARALIPQKDPGPYLLIDIGAKTSSIICFDQGTIKMTSTIATSGDDLATDFTNNTKVLANEIGRLVKYYQNRIGQATVFRQIILAGGGANVPNIAKGLEQLTKIKTVISWPVIKTKTYNPKFATVIGLAMKKI